MYTVYVSNATAQNYLHIIHTYVAYAHTMYAIVSDSDSNRARDNLPIQKSLFTQFVPPKIAFISQRHVNIERARARNTRSTRPGSHVYPLSFLCFKAISNQKWQTHTNAIGFPSHMCFLCCMYVCIYSWNIDNHFICLNLRCCTECVCALCAIKSIKFFIIKLWRPDWVIVTIETLTALLIAYVVYVT